MTSKNVCCYFWHELEGVLQSTSFASCLLDYIENELNNKDVNTIITISDGCGYQNVNTTMSNALTFEPFESEWNKTTSVPKYVFRSGSLGGRSCTWCSSNRRRKETPAEKKTFLVRFPTCHHITARQIQQKRYLEPIIQNKNTLYKLYQVWCN